MATSTFYARKKRITQIDGSNKSTTPKKQHLIPLFTEDVPEQLTSLLTLTTPAGYRLEFSDCLPHQKLNDCEDTLMINPQQVYLVTGFTDMRKSINGLSIIIAEQLELDPLNQAWYIFCDK